MVVGSFHHTSRRIHLTSFTILNCLYWIHLQLVCCQVAHISISTIGSPLYQLADSLVYHRLRFFLLLVVRKWWNKNSRMCKEKQINETKFKINTFFFLEHVTSDSLNCYLYKFFTFLFHHCQLLFISHTHPSHIFHHFQLSSLNSPWIGLLSSSKHLHLKYWFTIFSIGWFIGSSPSSLLLWLVVRKWWNKNTRMCKEKQ